MTDSHEGEPIDLLYERFRGMSLEQINTHLGELKEKVQAVKKHYEGPIGRFRTKIRKDDSEALSTAFGYLLPMSMNTAVQQEITASPDLDPHDWAISRITGVMEDLSLFLARFNNSGVKVFYTEDTMLD